MALFDHLGCGVVTVCLVLCSINEVEFSIWFSSEVQVMAQVGLDRICNQTLLHEDELKKEIEDFCVCICEYCKTPETVDVFDPNKNTSPFVCSFCYTVDAIEASHLKMEFRISTSTTSNLSYSREFNQVIICPSSLVKRSPLTETN